MRRKRTFCVRKYRLGYFKHVPLARRWASNATLASVQSSSHPVGCLNGIYAQPGVGDTVLRCLNNTLICYGVVLVESLTNPRVNHLLCCRNWRQWPDTPARWTRLCFPTLPSSCWPSACSSPPGSLCILQHLDSCWFAKCQPVYYESMGSFYC